ncbi:MAG: phosphate ABC transporter permease PstA [Chloroflexota bacterium]
MRNQRRRLFNRLMIGVVTGCAALSVGIMFLIIGYVTAKGVTHISVTFLTHEPTSLGEPGGGIKHALVGTLILVTIAISIAVPLGIGAGIFVSEYASPRLALPLRFLADVLTGVPSIVIGVFIYSLIVIQYGFSALAGGVALAVIMLPIVARTSEEALYLVPRDQREAALALGTPKWRMILQIVLPTAAPAVVTGCLLATARAAGETAPLLFTALGNNFYSTNVKEPIAAMPVIIYRYALTPYPSLHDQAWATAFILVGVMLVLSAITRIVVSRSIR